MNNNLYFETGPKGALKAARRGDLCIIVDVLRASTSIIAAFMGKIKDIRLGDNSSFIVEEGEISAGEQNCIKIPHFTYGNSPEALLNNQHPQSELIFFSTNGIPSILACAAYKVPTLIGAVINVTAVGAFAKEVATSLDKNISIILAGYKGDLEEDDLLAGSLIYYKALQSFKIASTIQPLYSANLLQSFLESPAGLRLAKVDLSKDIHFCAKENLTSIVPIYDHQIKRLVSTVYSPNEGINYAKAFY